MNKKAVAFLLLALVVVATLIARFVLIGSAPSVRLSVAPPLTGAISQSLSSGGGLATLPQPGKDYDLQNTHYFDNNTWIVTTIQPITNKFNQSVVIMQQANGGYQVVLGPGSSFDNSYLLSLPTDVGQYLASKGILYESVIQ
jgi:hypothetical protein